MCMNCVDGRGALAGAALVGYAVKPPLHRALARLGLVDGPTRRPTSRTVAFLRSLDLDPVEVLGADVVAAAEAWAPPPRPDAVRFAGVRLAASARPIGSHSLLTTQ